jgi:hypothetical protein
MAHAYSEEKLIVLGMNSFEFKEPRYWDTLHIKPNPNNIIEMADGIGEVDDVYGIIGDTQNLNNELDEDIDDYVTYMHSTNIGYHIEKYMPENNDWSYKILPYPYRANKRKR